MHSQYRQHTERSYKIVALTALCLGNNLQYLLDRRLIVDMKLAEKVAILLLPGIGRKSGSSSLWKPEV